MQLRRLTIEHRGGEDTSQLIERLSPDEGEVVRPEVLGDRAVARTTGGTAVTSYLGTHPTIVNTVDDVSLEVSLPQGINFERGEVVDDGTVVYEGVEGSVDAAVQALTDGSIRIQTVIREAEAPHEFEYVFAEGVTLVPDGDGIALVDRRADGSMTMVGRVDAPWAVDSTGAPVATEYELVDGALVQRVEPTETTVYPIVADPKISFGWGIYLTAYGYEWNAFSAAITTIVGGLAVYGCATAKGPAKWLPIIRQACTAIGASNAINFFNWIKKAVSGYASFTCYQYRYWNGWSGPETVASSNCSG